jgi:hypothetical protein
MFPDGRRIELFARKTVDGWDADGDQVGLLNQGPVKTRRQPSSLVAKPRKLPPQAFKSGVRLVRRRRHLPARNPKADDLFHDIVGDGARVGRGRPRRD